MEISPRGPMRSEHPVPNAAHRIFGHIRLPKQSSGQGHTVHTPALEVMPSLNFIARTDIILMEINHQDIR